MVTRYCKFKEKEVINCLDGRILGCVCDLVIDDACGSINAIVVPGAGKWAFFAKGDRDYVIPWRNIKKIGKDVIIVALDCNSSHFAD